MIFLPWNKPSWSKVERETKKLGTTSTSLFWTHSYTRDLKESPSPSLTINITVYVGQILLIKTKRPENFGTVIFLPWKFSNSSKFSVFIPSYMVTLYFNLPINVRRLLGHQRVLNTNFLTINLLLSSYWLVHKNFFKLLGY